MSSKLLSLIAGLIGAVASFFITREYFPNNNISDIGADIIVISEVQKQNDFLNTTIDKQKMVIDSLNSVITKKPKVIVKYIPKPVIVTKDNIVEVPVEIPVDVVIHDTVYIGADSIDISTGVDSSVTFSDVYILNDKDKIVLKFKKRYIKEGDVLNIFNGENLDELYLTYYNTNNIKRRMKFNTTSLYILATSTNKDIEQRITKMIKNKNKL